MGKVFLVIFLRGEPEMRPVRPRVCLIPTNLELETCVIQFEVVVCNLSKCFCFLDLNRKF